MLPLQHVSQRPVESATEMAALRPGFHRPLIGTMLAVVSLVLLSAGLCETPARITPAHPGGLPTLAVGDLTTMTSRPMLLGRLWAHARGMRPSAQEDATFARHMVHPAGGNGVTPQSPELRMLDFREPAISTLQPRRHGSDDRIANTLFIDGREPSVPGIVRDSHSCQEAHAESAHEAALPPCEERDVRWFLMEMARAQRGDWDRLCPCPMYADDLPAGSPQ
jgi:hypothetical protein